MPFKKVLTLEERLLSHRIITESGCWEWDGYRNKGGYGWIQIGSRTTNTYRGITVHRAAASVWLGLDLANPKIHACHHCDNRPCFNPAHLFLGTAADNIEDCRAKGRSRSSPGEKNGIAKLTDGQVIQLRELKRVTGMVDSEIARNFGISQSMASRIIRGEAWKHVA